MNAKKAKALRKLLRNLEKQNPAEKVVDRAYGEVTKNAVYNDIQYLTKDGEYKTETFKIAAGTLVNKQGTRRSRYKFLKTKLDELEAAGQLPK